MRPYTEQIKGTYSIREFTQNTPEDEFVWHRDREDRVIETLKTTDWMFQLENKLPINISESLFIPKGVYHRLIKGTGNLKVKIYKL